MITELVRQGVRVRPVDDRGCASYGGYMDLVYDVEKPYEVKLAGTGPEAGELVFGRELLATALLDGTPAGDGDVRIQLKRIRGARRCQLLLTFYDSVGEPVRLALREETVAGFLQATTDLVPAGEESGHLDVDAAIDALLRDAA